MIETDIRWTTVQLNLRSWNVENSVLGKGVTVVVAMVANTIDKQLDIVNKPVEQLLSLYVHH